MKSTTIQRLSRWLHPDRPGSGRSDEAIDRLIEAESGAYTSPDPDTHRRWQMLRNTITAGEPAPVALPPRAPSRILRPILLTGIVASVAAMVFLLWRTTPVVDQTFGTGRGQMSAIVLADSSDVILNHTSEVLVTAMEPGKPRTVHLKGEAFFKVRKNGSPFRVVTPLGTVEVLGTEFNVRERQGAFEVAVLSGKVRVIVSRAAGDRLVELTKGMILTLAQGDTACAAHELRYSAYPGWLHNQLIFQDRPLGSVCAELEDRFDIHVRIARPNAERDRISGTLESRTADNALSSLSALTGLSLRHDTDAYVLY